MDIDHFILDHQAEWNRLDELCRKGKASPANLDPAELQELLDLYQRTGGHLSVLRTQFFDASLANRLSISIGTARGLIYKKRPTPARAFTEFFTHTFPLGCWRAKRQILLAALLLFGPALASGIWFYESGNTRDAVILPEDQEIIAAESFEDYYSSQEATGWAFQLWTHNITVGVMAFGGCALLGGLGAWVLIQNGLNLGVVAAVMHAQGKGALFWGLIAPHGLIEMTAVVISAGAGLNIAWAIIAPGHQVRSLAIAEAGLRSISALLGAALVFVVAGFTEAFVTPSGLPTFARVGIGVLLELALLTWMFGIGRLRAIEEQNAEIEAEFLRPSLHNQKTLQSA